MSSSSNGLSAMSPNAQQLRLDMTATPPSNLFTCKCMKSCKCLSFVWSKLFEDRVYMVHSLIFYNTIWRILKGSYFSARFFFKPYFPAPKSHSLWHYSGKSRCSTQPALLFSHCHFFTLRMVTTFENNLERCPEDSRHLLRW